MRVMITNGEYTGLTGTVIDTYNSWGFTQYWVKLDEVNGTQTFYHYDIKEIEDQVIREGDRHATI